MELARLEEEKQDLQELNDLLDDAFSTQVRKLREIIKDQEDEIERTELAIKNRESDLIKADSDDHHYK